MLLVSWLVSQPFAALPSQSPKPAAQLTTVHIPAEHPAVALGKVHTRSQPPQLVGSVRVSSQPFRMLPSQSVNPGKHLGIEHSPPTHGAVVFGGGLQLRPQRPQLFPSVFRSTHEAPHMVHVGMQAPAEQAIPAGHALPHAPQWVAVSRRASQPVIELPSQFPKPGSHAPSTQPPPAHTAVAFVNRQTLLQPPQ